MAVWATPTGSAGAISAQRFDENGTALSGPFVIATKESYLIDSPHVAALANGGYAVSWAGKINDTNYLWDIYTKVYSASNVAVSSESRVSITGFFDQYESNIAGLAGGGFVVVSTRESGDVHDIYMRRYDANGTPLSDEVLVNAYTPGKQWQPSAVGLADGGYMVAWNSVGQDGSGYGVYAQRYTATGYPVGGSFQLAQVTAGDQGQPVLAARPDGGFVVAWSGQDRSDYGIKVREFVGTSDGGGGPVTIINGTPGSDALTGGSGRNAIYGWDGADTLIGGDLDDTLSGGNGNDSLIGGKGDDWIDGGDGADTMIGGAGNDVYVVASSQDVCS